MSDSIQGRPVADAFAELTNAMVLGIVSRRSALLLANSLAVLRQELAPATSQISATEAAELKVQLLEVARSPADGPFPEAVGQRMCAISDRAAAAEREDLRRRN